MTGEISSQPQLADPTIFDSLPLVVFERYMLADDRPHEPMAFQIRLLLGGRVDGEALRGALHEAVARHPLLRARLAGFERSNLKWVDGGQIWLDCQPRCTPLVHPDSASINLRHEPGLRTWARYDDDQTELRFHFHHSCSDGIGAYRFIDDVLCLYHNRVSPDQAVTLRTVRPELLKQRTKMGRTWWRYLLRLPLTLIAVTASPLEFKLAPPRELCLPEFTGPEEDQLRTVVDMPAEKLGKDEVSRLARAAKAQGVSLNDLLMRDTMVALKNWNERVTGEPFRGRLGLVVPFNLRSAEDDQQTVTNIVGMAPINVSAKQIANPAGLLGFIAVVMRYYKRFQLAIEFMAVITVIERLFGSLNTFVGPNHCSATATFSNVGRVFSDSPLPRVDDRLQVGNLTLQTVESAPPIRPHTWVSFTTLSYLGELTVIANYDRLALSQQTAHEIVKCVVEQLRASAAS